ncbi:MAG: hypothetical protein CME60_04190 [Halobacteriovoraceae bacterium]|jgi:uncharacterized membrane protein YkvA (DUF1232 family)|nr:hypothetical protein [Halobacteriovoraceae bacterium]|tara:strand:- start:726 stop:1124 length:399 start_codon:yes stop_codon:yes gene_type:complete
MKIEQYLNWAKSKFNDQAKTILQSSSAIKSLAKSVEEKLSSSFIKEQFKNLWNDLKIVIALLKDTATRKYSPRSKKDVTLIIVGLLYFINPMDIIPDLLVGGFIDDAAVLSWILNKTKEEIDHYKSTRNNSP